MARAKTRYSVLRVAESDGFSQAATRILNRNFDAIKSDLDAKDTSPVGIKAILAGTSSTEDLTGSKIRFLDTVASLFTAGVTWAGVKTGSDDEPDTIQATITALGGGAPVGGSGVATEVAFWAGTVGSPSSTLAGHDNLFWSQFPAIGIPGGELRVTYDEAASIDGGTAALVPLVLRAKTSSLPAAGFGTSAVFQAYNSAYAMTTLGIVSHQWDDSTAGSEDSYISWATMTAGTVTEKMRLTAGRLGIGTSSPSYPVHARGGPNALHLLAAENTSTGTAAGAGFQFITPDTDGTVYVYSSGATGDIVGGVSKAGKFIVAAGAAADGMVFGIPGMDSFYWGAAGSGLMQLAADGFLTVGGIGTGAVFDTPIMALGTTAATSTIAARIMNATASTAGVIELDRARGTNASPTAATDGDALGSLVFRGYTDAFKNAARIHATAGTGWGASGNDAPGTLWFATSPDGSATPVDHVKLTQNGLLSLVADGDAFEIAGSSPAVGVAATGHIRQRNNAGVWQASQSTAAWRDASPLTTKGDVFTSSSTNNVRLPVGVNTEVLVADSTAAEGLMWESRNGHMSWGVSSAVAGTRYLGAWNRGNVSLATETLAAQIVATRLGTLGGGGAFRAKVTTAPGVGNTHTFTLRINGVNTSVTITIAGAATTGAYFGTGVAIAAGDYVTCQFVRSAGAGSPGIALAEAGY